MIGLFENFLKLTFCHFTCFMCTLILYEVEGFVGKRKLVLFSCGFAPRSISWKHEFWFVFFTLLRFFSSSVWAVQLLCVSKKIFHGEFEQHMTQVHFAITYLLGTNTTLLIKFPNHLISGEYVGFNPWRRGTPMSHILGLFWFLL